VKNKIHRINGLIDAALFAGFVLACFLELTGREAHQWLGMAIGGLALYHLWRHRAWASAAARRWVTGLASRARLFALLDLGLFAGLGAIIFTGVVISSWLNLPLGNYAAWRDWHVGITLATLGLLVVKLGVHWRWIVQTLRAPARAPTTTLAPAPAASPIRTTAPAGALSRRDFLQVMGLVSVAALLAGARVVSSQTSAAATALNSDQQTTAATAAAAPTASAAATAGSSTACQVRCNRRCSYPGRCRRYTDTNQNGRCDLGECS
jgi:hypothetical protein